jgi:hypothetical protein
MSRMTQMLKDPFFRRRFPGRKIDISVEVEVVGYSRVRFQGMPKV